METPPVSAAVPRQRGFWPVVTWGLLGAGWLTFLLVQGHAARLAEWYGPCPDVCDALGRDAFVRRRTLPYFTLVVLLDGLAAVSLAAGSRSGWPLAIKVLAAVLLVPSMGLHGLVWLVCALIVV